MKDLTIVQNLKEKGYRITKVRKAIIAILHSAKNPLSAKDILVELYKKDLSANKTTVYRELEFLLSKGVATGVEFGDGRKRYELVSENHHHHVVCVNCGTVKDIDIDLDIEKSQSIAENKTGFKIHEHALELFGLCKKCQY